MGPKRCQTGNSKQCLIEGYVSPSYKGRDVAQGTIESRIAVFEDRWKGWYFGPAKLLLAQPNGRGMLPAVHLVTAYFETYAAYRKGQDSKGRSQAFFRDGFLDVFSFRQAWKQLTPNMNMPTTFRANISNRFYKAVRCGLFHSGMPKQDIVITDRWNAALTVRTNKAGVVSTIIVGPTRMLGQIEAHLEDYVHRLRDPDQRSLRSNFTKAWELLNPPVVVAIPPLGVTSPPPGS